MYRRIIRYIKQVERISKSPAYCSVQYKAGDFHNPAEAGIPGLSSGLRQYYRFRFNMPVIIRNAPIIILHIRHIR